MKLWRWVSSAVSGGVIGLTLFGFLSVFLLFVEDAAPQSMHRWATLISTAAGIASGVTGLATMFVVARAASGPSLVRRVGWCLGALGTVGTAGGFFLFFVPTKALVHPGRMPAGDVAPLFVKLLVTGTGAIILASGLLVALTGLGWTLIRRGQPRATDGASG